MTHGFLHPEAVTNDAEERQMIVIIDADYNEEIGKAHIAGIVAETIFDEKEKMVVTAISDEIGEYIPGQFYKRELKSVELIIAQLEVSQIKLIVVDGYADFGTDKLALGAYVFEKYNIPVIGIGKNKFEGLEADDCIVIKPTNINKFKQANWNELILCNYIHETINGNLFNDKDDYKKVSDVLCDKIEDIKDYYGNNQNTYIDNAVKVVQHYVNALKLDEYLFDCRKSKLK